MSKYLLALAVLVSPGFAQSFSYPDFSNTTGLVLNNHATVTGNVLAVTPALISQRGTVWTSAPVDVAGGFDTSFTFRMTTPSGGGGDGLAFVIQVDPRGATALGNHASALGYGAFVGVATGTAIANSLAIELDSYQGSFGGFSDLSGNEISVHTGGTGDNSQSEGYSIGRINAAVNFSNGANHTLRIRYVAGTLEIYLDNPTTPVLSIAYDLLGGGTQILPNTPVSGLNLVNNRQAFVGFAASTGGAWETHEILNWSWTSFEGCLAGAVPGLGGSPADVVTVNGSSWAPGRVVRLGLNQPIAVDISVPPLSGLPTANYILLANIGYPAAGGGLDLGIGSLCFLPPLPGLPATSFVLLDTFNFGLGTLLPGTPPAPYTLSLPGGLASPAVIVLQGVIEIGGGGLAVTNGVTLDIR